MSTGTSALLRSAVMEALGGIIGTIGLVVAGVGIWGLWKGRVGWAHLSSRGIAGGALAGGLVVTSIGGSLIPDEEPIANRQTTTSEAVTTTMATTTTVLTTTTTPPVTTPRPTIPRATTPPTAPPVTTVPSGSCHPSYTGACVPIASDVDCGGGSGNGPAYVYEKRFRVVGPDEYGLDGNDNDGIACES